MSEERVQFVLSARDQATATVKRLKGELGAMGGAAGTATGPLGKLSAVTGGLISPMTLGIGAAVGLVGAFGAAATAAIDEERGVALLTTALRENAPAAAGNIAQIEATITERQKLAFADDEQRESLGALVAVTKDSEKALALQRTAMDLARLKGMSLADATTLLGKVYGGNIGILSRYGIQLEAGTTSTEALAEIQKRAAGQAEAFGETTAGAMQAAGLAFDDVVEDIGAQLLPVLTELAHFASDTLIPALREIGGTIGEVIGAIGNFATEVERGLNDMALNFGDMGTRVHEVADSMGADFDATKDLVNYAMTDLDKSFEQAAQYAEEQLARFPDATDEEMRKAVDRIITRTPEMRAAMAEAGKSYDAYLAAMYAGVGPVREAAEKLAVQPRHAVEAEWAAIRSAAYQTQVEMAKGLMDGQNAPKVAMDAAMQMLEDELTRTQEVARLKGQQITLQTAAGIASQEGKTASLIAINAALNVVTTRLAELGPSARGVGALVNPALAQGINANLGVAINAGQAVRNAASGAMANTGWAYTGGLNTGRSYAAGIAAAAYAVFLASHTLTISAAGALRGYSPPKEGPLKDIDKWGFNVGSAWAEGFGGAASVGRAEAARLASSVSGLGGVGAGAIAPSGFGGGGAGATTTHTGPLVHIVNFNGTQQNIDELARQLALRMRLQGVVSAAVPGA